ncbi:hypothetical protein ACJJI4_11445 [Microbulbifer sp. TRSA002]|uniref:hypothetical protein n=1 Tax=Microbulbifer sp. TRSA002 TaxID=3243382 RepID=UPI00403967B4
MKFSFKLGLRNPLIFVTLSALAVVPNYCLGLHFSVFEDKFECIDIHNSLNCARSIESGLSDQVNHIQRTQPGHLTIALNSEKSLTYTDILPANSPAEHIAYSAIEQITDNLLLIHQQLWEAHSYILLDLRNGHEYSLAGYPLLSPQGGYLFVAEQDLDAGFNENALQVYKLSENTLDLLYELKPENWGPEQAYWTTENAVSFTQKQLNPNYFSNENQPFYIETKAVLSIAPDSQRVNIRYFD